MYIPKNDILNKRSADFLQINESVENYLECILMLSHKGEVHSVMIAKELNVTKASVSHAVKLLRENGYITMDAENHLWLTPTGKSIAENMYTRHKILSDFLVKIGVNEKIASEDACRMEHDVSEDTFNAIKNFINK